MCVSLCACVRACVCESSPDVQVGEHLQVDDGFGDTLDAVVVEVERLQRSKQTHLPRDLRQAVLGEVCKKDRQQPKGLTFMGKCTGTHSMANT